jgi:hypothetical protein
VSETHPTADDILSHLIEIHQAAAAREDLPDWVRQANAHTARRIRKALEEDDEPEEGDEEE